ncbi:MAG TPA: hypothetical protein DEQ38_04590 [Elusimicrobia bacterium]|nr:MAG: hypothetical protein A2089_00555 [Elusimicrobia bacterium GWD2_63_28]HCC47379.1 hypothetical protein [Elusimicrobiota bacterium]
MQIKKFRDMSVNVFFLISLCVLLVIAAASGFILEAERDSALDYTRMRAEIFAKRAAPALFPRTDIFSLHFLVNTLALEKIIKYSLVSDQAGRVLSHSNPECIGDTDGSREGVTARNSKTPLAQEFKGADGLGYYYFSSPVLIGKKRLGTVALAMNSETLGESLASTRQKLVIIFLAAVAAMLLLWQLRAFMREERRSAALKSAMVHTVSHEFNNALTVIDAAVFMLEETEPKKTTPARTELFRTLEFERKSLGRYVKNILNEARMEAGRFKLEKKTLALRDLVAGIVYSMEGLLRQKKITFALELPEKRVLVAADKEALSLVISNLLGNAVKYTPAGGRVSVRMAADAPKAGRITFYAENSGRGISPEEIRKIKEEFYRTEDGKAAASGFGLGLRICNEMLLLHGSELEISSEPGKSSCFYFSLAAAEEPRANEQA